MMTQVHTIAAQSFSDEINRLIAKNDTAKASELAIGLNTCLQGLRLLQGKCPYP
jgi:hypothetical protein